MRIREIMSTPAITVQAGTPIAAAAALLAEKGFTALPVTDDDDHLVGIVTEADLIRDRIAADPRIHGRTVPPTHPRRPETVADVMTTSVESLTPGADVADAARMMLAENIRCFPIVDGNAIVGLVTRRDVLRAGVVHSDGQLGEAVAGELSALDDSGRFAVTVQAGVADIEDYGNDSGGRAAAARAAAAVPGIVAVAVRHQTCDPF
jgi:CBS domain-containing protein